MHLFLAYTHFSWLKLLWINDYNFKTQILFIHIETEKQYCSNIKETIPSNGGDKYSVTVTQGCGLEYTTICALLVTVEDLFCIILKENPKQNSKSMQTSRNQPLF